jgi:uncharacterized protein (TIGR00369 family)
VTGLELMQAILEGRVPKPPIQGLLGFELVDVSEGRAVFRLETRQDMTNPLGTVHGGIAMTLIDSATGCAVHTTLGESGAYGTLETKVNLVRAINPDTGALIAEGRIVHRGARVATAEAQVTGEADGKLYAHGTSTCMVLG